MTGVQTCALPISLEQVMSIAYLGPEGTYTQAAALKHFGHSVETVSQASIADVFREVESGNAAYGVEIGRASCRERV